MTTTRITTTTRRPLTGLAAALALLVLVVGVPITLSVVAPIGLPDSWPAWSEIWHIVMRPDDGRLALSVIQLVAWGAWAAFTWSVVIEARAALRNTTAPEIHALGFLQRAAAVLVAALLLSLAGAAHTPIAGAATPNRSAMQIVPDAGVPEATRLTQAAPTPQVHGSASRAVRADPQLPVVTVSDGDSLWFLAERHLGAGSRYTEILDLNLGRPQRDGSGLTDAHWIEPGWQLVLPADAVDVPPASGSITPPADSSDSVVVAPGDSLWKLAQAHLGDGDRYPEIFELNVGVVQRDGEALTDPGLIRPGWVLTLPDAQVVAPHSVARVAPLAGPEAGVQPDGQPDSGSEAFRTDGSVEPDSGFQRDARPNAGTTSTGAGQVTAPTPAASSSGLPAGPNAAPVPDPEHSDVADSASDPAPRGALASETSGPLAHESSASNGLYLGLTALAAAGIVGELSRRRRLQHRVRRTGERISLPDAASAAAAAERQWHAAVTPLTLRQLRIALDALAASCFAADRDLPRVAAIDVAADRVTLHLLEDEPDSAVPFTQSTSPRVWSAPTTSLATLEPVETHGAPEPYPALVTIGHTETSTILLNLEAAGTLRVVGDPDAAAGTLRALVAELATSELSGRIGLTGGAQFAGLARACSPTRVQASESPLAASQLNDRLQSARDSLAANGLDDTLQARSDRHSPDLWLPVVYVDEVPGPAPCGPWSGSILLTDRDGSGGWRLDVGPDGRARVDVLGLELTASRLTADGLATITELLSHAVPAQAEEPVGPPEPARDEAAQTLAALRPIAPTTSLATTTAVVDGRRGLRINVLGPIRFENVPTDQAPSPIQAELLVLLALRGVCTGPEIDDALWPGRRSDGNSRWGLAYRTRRIVLSRNLPQTGSSRSRVWVGRARRSW